MNYYQKEFLPLIVYQVYPKSFCDGNGDGVGDFKGFESKLDYLKELGINAVWFSPCFPSPNIDNGYDISDYCDIDSVYGDLEQFKALIKKMHNKGIKVILDLVANHTSDKHKWFLESKKSKDNEYSDYYYWVDKPINNWPSHNFGTSVWEYSKERNQYYLHSFAKEQPDLNWTNEKVRKEIKDIVMFWVDLGVDGFRCDVLDMISKDFSKPDDSGNGNGPKLNEYLNELFGDEKLKHVFTVGECWGVNIDKYRKVCGEKSRELKSSFSFGHILKHIGESRFIKKDFKFSEFVKEMYMWVNATKEDLLYPLVLENHDQPRIVSKYGDENEYRYESATMLATLAYCLKGIPFIYQGQEIGMVNANYPDISFYDDIETINYYNNRIKTNPETVMKECIFGSRDNGRRIIAWNKEKLKKFWLEPHNLYEQINVEDDINSQKSIYKYYQKLLKLRKNEKTLIYGDFKEIITNDNYTVYERSYNDKTFYIVCNFKDKSKIDIDLSSLKVVLSNYDRENLKLFDELQPYETIIVVK